MHEDEDGAAETCWKPARQMHAVLATAEQPVATDCDEAQVPQLKQAVAPLDTLNELAAHACGASPPPAQEKPGTHATQDLVALLHAEPALHTQAVPGQSCAAAAATRPRNVAKLGARAIRHEGRRPG